MVWNAAARQTSKIDVQERIDDVVFIGLRSSGITYPKAGSCLRKLGVSNSPDANDHRDFVTKNFSSGELWLFGKLVLE